MPSVILGVWKVAFGVEFKLKLQIGGVFYGVRGCVKSQKCRLHGESPWHRFPCMICTALCTALMLSIFNTMGARNGGRYQGVVLGGRSRVGVVMVVVLEPEGRNDHVPRYDPPYEGS